MTLVVDIHPLPIAYRQFRRFLPRPPRIFSNGEPSTADRELALELWRSLDAQSKRWYTNSGSARTFAGLPLTDADIASMDET